jgi:hypothetical protein
MRDNSAFSRFLSFPKQYKMTEQKNIDNTKRGRSQGLLKNMEEFSDERQRLLIKIDHQRLKAIEEVSLTTCWNKEQLKALTKFI